MDLPPSNQRRSSQRLPWLSKTTTIAAGVAAAAPGLARYFLVFILALPQVLAGAALVSPRDGVFSSAVMGVDVASYDSEDIQTRAMRFNLIRFTPGIPIKMPVEGEVDTDVLLVNCDLPEAADSAAMDLIYSTRRLILYYTLEHDYCQDSDGSLKGQRIWTIVDKLTAHKLHAATATATSTRRISVTLTPVKAKSLSSELKKRQGDGESQEKNIWSSPAPSTSIALIILYSITGVITFLFLVIIIVGAVRAHRHPERYGPRGISRMGQPPQSRARGLARAVLDTIPIVRFGGTTAHPPTVKGDLEMQEGTDKMPDGTVYPINEGGSEETGRQERDAGGLSASPTPTIEQPECPVCMDEFQEGQELRVLPCSHQFHQACIDEWLLNIAGSCPLCRIDLHPEGSDEEDIGGGIPDTSPSHRPRFSRYLAIARTTYGEEREEAMRELQEEHRRQGFRPMRRSMLFETGIDRMRRVSRVLNRHSRHEPMQDASPDGELSASTGGNNPTATAEEISRPPPAAVQNRNYM